MIHIIRKPKFRIAPRDPVEFECQCGCKFTAERTDYRLTSRMNAAYLDRGAYRINCPACGANCYSDKKAQEKGETENERTV